MEKPMPCLKWAVTACLLVAATPAFAQIQLAAPDKALAQPPEYDGGNEGILRHGRKFGVSIGMSVADADRLLLARNGVFDDSVSCAGRPADADCVNAETERTYEIERHSVLTIPLARYVTLSITGGKVSQIHWWPKPFSL
jgi:hypothetical protein